MPANYPSVVYVSKSASDPRAASDINQLQDDVLAHANDYITGWITAGETWVYASATTFTVTGDKTTKYRKGTKIKLTQTTDKYFYVVAVSYSAPNTTVTLAAGSDYSLANATITSPYYSYADCPQGFPDWFTWAPTSCGFDTFDPVGGYRFCVRGNICYYNGFHNSAGCSNAATIGITLPITSGSPGTVDNYAWAGILGLYMDNGSALTGGRISIGQNSPSMGMFTNSAAGTWQTTGSKRARAFQGFYEF